ncbi:hypothetical protein [Paracoccus albus]|uniref:hypothetical protein n=1 Tax=Paracoccus albus TaxID=3017784 RepID=UPI0022F108B3|nr:hypothetical protein [Paracoccus albus]WBU62053.1 hypothetical protein PAF20_17405 [Paracoccus albus]
MNEDDLNVLFELFRDRLIAEGLVNAAGTDAVPSGQPVSSKAPAVQCCPICGSADAAPDSDDDAPPVWFVAEGGYSSRIKTMRIWIELQEALIDWKDRHCETMPETRLDEMAASAVCARMDVLAAVNLSFWFRCRGVYLHYNDIASDETLQDVVTTLQVILEDLGHIIAEEL